MFKIVTVHEINATPKDVWNVLTDFSSYSEWNPFIISAKRNDNRLRITTEPPGDKARSFSPRVVEVVANSKFRWVGIVFSKFLLRAEHSFELQHTKNNGTRLIHGETFSGLLAYTIPVTQRTRIQQGFEAMNSALAIRVDYLKGNK